MSEDHLDLGSRGSSWSRNVRGSSRPWKSEDHLGLGMSEDHLDLGTPEDHLVLRMSEDHLDLGMSEDH